MSTKIYRQFYLHTQFQPCNSSFLKFHNDLKDFSLPHQATRTIDTNINQSKLTENLNPSSQFNSHYNLSKSTKKLLYLAQDILIPSNENNTPDENYNVQLLNWFASGNKLRKMQWLLDFNFPKLQRIISFGGTQSNSMVALATIAYMKGWEFEYYTKQLSTKLKSNLNFIQNISEQNFKEYSNLTAAVDLFNMNLIEMSNQDLEEKIKELESNFSIPSQIYFSHSQNEILTNNLFDQDTIFVPQGGAMSQASYGIAELAQNIIQFCNREFPHKKNRILCVMPSGTGTTAALLNHHIQSTLKSNTTFKEKENQYHQNFLNSSKNNNRNKLMNQDNINHNSNSNNNNNNNIEHFIRCLTIPTVGSIDYLCQQIENNHLFKDFKEMNDYYQSEHEFRQSSTTSSLSTTSQKLINDIWNNQNDHHAPLIIGDILQSKARESFDEKQNDESIYHKSFRFGVPDQRFLDVWHQFQETNPHVNQLDLIYAPKTLLMLQKLINCVDCDTCSHATPNDNIIDLSVEAYDPLSSSPRNKLDRIDVQNLIRETDVIIYIHTGGISGNTSQLDRYHSLKSI